MLKHGKLPEQDLLEAVTLVEPRIVDTIDEYLTAHVYCKLIMAVLLCLGKSQDSTPYIELIDKVSKIFDLNCIFFIKIFYSHIWP